MSLDHSHGGASERPAPPTAGRSLLKTVLFILAVLVVLLIVVIAMQPDELRIVRSASISAPPAEVFPHVNDFHAWQEWSPWARLDPQAENSFSGPAAGEGAVFKWSGNRQVGKGQMTLLESQPNERIRIRLDFTEPMQDTSDVVFTFNPEDGGTRVTWEMSGKNTFISKAFGLFMNIEKMVGDQFSEGLANLKQVVEAPQNGAAPQAQE